MIDMINKATKIANGKNNFPMPKISILSVPSAPPLIDSHFILANWPFSNILLAASLKSGTNGEFLVNIQPTNNGAEAPKVLIF